jgi:hypothetical protein
MSAFGGKADIASKLVSGDTGSPKVVSLHAIADSEFSSAVSPREFGAENDFS